MRVAEASAPRDADGQGRRQPVDQMIEQLLPHLEKGDIIIDGGNSHVPDTNRRTKALADQRHSFHRNRRFRRRRGRTIRPVDHAGRNPGSVAAREGYFPERSPQKWKTARRAAIGWAKTARATT